MYVTLRFYKKLLKVINSQNYTAKFNYSLQNESIEINQASNKRMGTNRMFAWQIHSYGNFDELQLSKSARPPYVNSPNDVLVKVLASSVNPIDVMMISGYGSSILNKMRQLEQLSLQSELEFPLILGRDCCGILEAKGNGVGNDVNVGDLVYGVSPVHHQGCHAERVLLHKSLVRRVPNYINIEEAGSILFAGMTAWSALKLTGDLWLLPSSSKKVLVLGASGGVGTIAVQLLKAWNAEVVATCSTDAEALVRSLNVNQVVDYSKPNAMEEIKYFGKYDIILDCAGLGECKHQKYVELLKDWSGAKYITLNTPFLKNVDNYGIIPGMLRNAADLLLPNLSTGAVTRGSTVRWGFFMPLSQGLDEVHKLVSERKIKPVIHKVYRSNELPEAYKAVKKGHLRGKVVVKLD